jgi:hypothetical protein
MGIVLASSLVSNALVADIIIVCLVIALLALIARISRLRRETE